MITPTVIPSISLTNRATHTHVEDVKAAARLVPKEYKRLCACESMCPPDALPARLRLGEHLSHQLCMSHSHSFHQVLAALFLADNFAVDARQGSEAAMEGKPRSPAETAERWGISVATMARVEALGQQVDTTYQGWVRSRDRAGNLHPYRVYRRHCIAIRSSARVHRL